MVMFYVYFKGVSGDGRLVKKVWWGWFCYNNVFCVVLVLKIYF